jgi:hypothetical protein
MIGARLATLKSGQRADLVQAPSIEGAARLLNVGHASIERARTVIAQGEPKLVKAVESGDVSVSAAVEKIRHSHRTGVAMAPHNERGNDLYQTPAPAVHALLDVEPLPKEITIWEPFAGKCRIVNVLRACGHNVIATDLIDYGCGATGGIDFLKQESAPDDAKLILSNPPYMHADACVRKALSLGVRRVIMLLRFLFYAEQGRSDILENAGLARIYVFRNRLQLHRDGWTGPRANPQLVLAWFVWEHEHRGPAELHRISWKPEAPSADPNEMPSIPDFLRRSPIPHEVGRS